MTEARLARRRSLPAGGAIAMRAMADGWPVRTLFWPGRGRGCILLLTGRGDFAEKYAETLHNLVDAGWGVLTFDWRGQGLSGRLGDAPEKGHAISFDPWVRDLGEMIGWAQTLSPGPWSAVAHSMGGHILLRHLVAGGDGVARAVLLSPMLGMLAPPIGPRLASALARLMVISGRGGEYVAGGGPRIKAAAGSARQLLLTSDAERYGDEAWWSAQEPRFSMGSATYGWLNAAFQSVVQVFAGLAQLQLSVLMMIPAQDGLVDNAATRRAAALIPGAVLEILPGAGHELLREMDMTRARVLARLTAFLEDRL